MNPGIPVERVKELTRFTTDKSQEERVNRTSQGQRVGCAVSWFMVQQYLVHRIASHRVTAFVETAIPGPCCCPTAMIRL